MLKLKTKKLKKHLVAIGSSLLLSSLIFYSFFIFQKEEVLAAGNLERFHALSKLTDISKNLENELQSAILYTDFFSIIISQNPDIKPELLEMYSSLALKYNKNIKSVQFAPNSIIQVVYPKEENQAVIGHNLLADPDRKEFAEKAIEKKVVVLQGPIVAKQGGVLLFNRKAIFFEKDGVETLWGLAVVAVDFDKLIEKYKNSLNDVNYLFALRAKDHNEQDNFFGPVGLFAEKSIITSIDLPEATWEIAIYPKQGWKDEHSVFNYFNKIFYFIFIIIFLLSYLSIKNYLENIIRLKNDQLTDTLNKNSIKEIVDNKSKNRDHPFAFLVMDINNFKNINDSLGHYVGDCVLIEVASRLKKVLRSVDALSRFGGDEYIAVLDNLGSTTAVDIVIKRMLDDIAKPMMIEKNLLSISISIGYAFFPNEAKSYNELYKIADKAMYDFKKERKKN